MFDNASRIDLDSNFQAPTIFHAVRGKSGIPCYGCPEWISHAMRGKSLVLLKAPEILQGITMAISGREPFRKLFHRTLAVFSPETPFLFLLDDLPAYEPVSDHLR